MTPAVNAWLPETDQFRLAILGKLAEEASELSARCARCIIHGIDQVDPDSKRTNRIELAREASDVLACLEVLRETLSVSPIDTRTASKANGFRQWHAMIEQEQNHGR